MAWKMSLYERLDQYFKLSLEHFTYKRKDKSWSQVLHLLDLHLRFENLTQEEAESLKLKARGYYDKRVQKLEKNIRWRRKTKLTTKHTTKTDTSSDEYKMDVSLRE